jgi:hypothetical protein
MGAAGAALIVLSMMPRVGRRRGGAPKATRDDMDSRRSRRFTREREPVAAGDRDPTMRQDPVTDDGATRTPHGAVAASEHRGAHDDDRR